MAARVPLTLSGPVTAFKLMLNVEQPDAAHTGEPKYRQLNQQIRLPTHRLGGNKEYADNGKVRQHDAHTLFVLHFSARQPVAQQEIENSAEAPCIEIGVADVVTKVAKAPVVERRKNEHP
ncbi:hypothetical protein [Marinobacter sp. LV10R510-11A]|uniref:hypothetical protein n=1 Tax=Marinobacter sp. LV10R510-11A TaxID=1415568 RepID=UPI000BB7E436|nr:hypothetical protein [Marinobacter sp. LV10R510-11A]